MKIAIAAIAAVAATLVGHRIMSNSLRSAMIDKEIQATLKADLTAIDLAAAAIEDMVSEGLYENKSVADIQNDFNSLVMIYAAK